MDRLWRPEHQLVHGYLCVTGPNEWQVATWTKEITEFAVQSGYQPGSIFIDRSASTGGFARSGFIELLAALRRPDVFGVVVPSLAHLSSDSFTQHVLIHMVQLTNSQVLAASGPSSSSMAGRSSSPEVAS